MLNIALFIYPINVYRNWLITCNNGGTLAFCGSLEPGVGNRGCESCEVASMEAVSTSAKGSGTDGRLMGGVAAEANAGGTGEEEEEGEGQTPAGKVYEHWYVDRPPRVRSSRMAAIN